MREEKDERKQAAINRCSKYLWRCSARHVLWPCSFRGFLGGDRGQLYKQFAVTVAIAVVISGVTALTLTQALCALLLSREVESRLFRPFNAGLANHSDRS